MANGDMKKRYVVYEAMFYDKHIKRISELEKK